MCVFFPAFPPLQCCSRGVNVFNRTSLLGALQSRWCGAFAAGSPRGSWRSVCKPPLQKRSVALHWGGPWVHPATLVGWMSQLHHSNSGRLRMLIFPSQIQQHSGLSSFLIGQAKMGLMLTRRKKTRGARSTDVDLVFEGLLSDCL